MACCKCCCGNADCAEGDSGKCCCGGASGTCCQEGEYCCSGACQPGPCCEDDADCSFYTVGSFAAPDDPTCGYGCCVFLFATYEEAEAWVNDLPDECLASAPVIDGAYGKCCDGACYPTADDLPFCYDDCTSVVDITCP